MLHYVQFHLFFYCRSDDIWHSLFFLHFFCTQKAQSTFFLIGENLNLNPTAYIFGFQISLIETALIVGFVIGVGLLISALASSDDKKQRKHK
jgi:hypothetical protein